jgi:hypothetical protein
MFQSQFLKFKEKLLCHNSLNSLTIFKKVTSNSINKTVINVSFLTNARSNVIFLPNTRLISGSFRNQWTILNQKPFDNPPADVKLMVSFLVSFPFFFSETSLLFLLLASFEKIVELRARNKRLPSIFKKNCCFLFDV